MQYLTYDPNLKKPARKALRISDLFDLRPHVNILISAGYGGGFSGRPTTPVMKMWLVRYWATMCCMTYDPKEVVVGQVVAGVVFEGDLRPQGVSGHHGRR